MKRILDGRSSRGALPLADAIYVGDETRDIAAAHRVGIKAAAVCWGANTRLALEAMTPDFLLEHPSELPSILS